jgi:hypothetical protein
MPVQDKKESEPQEKVVGINIDDPLEAHLEDDGGFSPNLWTYTH